MRSSGDNVRHIAPLFFVPEMRLDQFRQLIHLVCQRVAFKSD